VGGQSFCRITELSNEATNILKYQYILYRSLFFDVELINVLLPTESYFAIVFGSWLGVVEVAAIDLLRCGSVERTIKNENSVY